MPRFFMEYRKSIRLSSEPFYALIMAAMRQADTNNLEKLQQAWPNVLDELRKRYNAPGGALDDQEMAVLQREMELDNLLDERDPEDEEDDQDEE